MNEPLTTDQEALLRSSAHLPAATPEALVVRRLLATLDVVRAERDNLLDLTAPRRRTVGVSVKVADLEPFRGFLGTVAAIVKAAEGHDAEHAGDSCACPCYGAALLVADAVERLRSA